MIKKFILLLALAFPFIAGAQTIHWLTFIDTTDENVGDLDQNGRKVLYNHFINLVNAALAEKGYKSNIQDIYGTTLTPQKCKEVVTGLNCKPEDIVMFYYIGHGTHGTTGGDVWPMMFMAQNDPNKLVPLKWVHDQLKTKGAKLTATIGMCCNVYQGISRKSSPTFGVNYGSTYLTDTEKKAIQNMFLNHQGDFLLASASPGQSSVGGLTPLGPMDLFTCVLVTNFEDGASEGKLDWDNLFSDVKYVVDVVTEGEQTPIFASNLRKAQAPQPPKPAAAPVPVTPPAPAPAAAPKQAPSPQAAPAKPATPAPSGQDWINNISAALDNLIDVRQTERARIAQATEFEKAFTPDAMVKVMSQDGDVVIDKSSADDFIGRLATSRILLKVAPVSVTVRGDKIISMEVKEIYKR